MKKISIFILILGTFSCKEIKREGISEENRNYKKIILTPASGETMPSDALFVLETLKREQLINEIFSLADSVLGKTYCDQIKTENLNKEFADYWFESREKFEKKNYLLDKQKIADDLYGDAASHSEVMTPYVDFNNFVQAADPFQLHTVIGHDSIGIRFELLPGPNWIKTGSFTYIKKDKETVTKTTMFGYSQLLTFRVYLAIANSETGKKEYYQKLIGDSCTVYTLMDMEAIDILNAGQRKD